MNAGFEFPFRFVIEVALASLVVVLPAALIGLFFDLVLLIANRFLIKSMADATAGRVLALGFTFNLIWFFLLVETTRFGSVEPRGDPFLIFLEHSLNSGGNQGLYNLGLLFGMRTNFFTLLASCSALVVLSAALLHRVFWPVVSRTINGLYEWQVLTSRPIQLAIAGAFLSYPFPWIGSVIKLLRGEPLNP
jgi:hypothetical protein